MELSIRPSQRASISRLAGHYLSVDVHRCAVNDSYPPLCAAITGRIPKQLHNKGMCRHMFTGCGCLGSLDSVLDGMNRSTTLAISTSLVINASGYHGPVSAQ